MALKLRRTTNFSEEERLLLAELGKEFPVIENKAYDNKTLGKKTKAWEAILSRYNSVNPGGIKRDLNQLQGCWRRLKIQTKKEFDTHRRESRKTGGGKAPMSPSQVCKVVADVIPTSVNPLHNEFDDDALVVLSENVVKTQGVTNETEAGSSGFDNSCKGEASDAVICVQPGMPPKQEDHQR